MRTEEENVVTTVRSFGACRIDRFWLEQLFALLKREGARTIVLSVDDGSGSGATEISTTAAAADCLAQGFALLEIRADFEGARALQMQLSNALPASCRLAAFGDAGWAASMAAAVEGTLQNRSRSAVSLCYGRIGVAFVQTAVPFLLASVLVVIAASLLIPGEIRRSSWNGWITAGCLVLTLRVAYSISNALLRQMVRRIPFVDWVRV